MLQRKATLTQQANAGSGSLFLLVLSGNHGEGVSNGVLEPFSIQAKFRRAVDLFWKERASRPAEFGADSEDLELMRYVVNDDRFRDFIALKIHERKNP